MTKNARPRHAAPSRATRLMGRAALGVLGAPVAMLAVAGPAGAAELDMGGWITDGDMSGSAGMEVDTGDGMPGADEFALPEGDGPDTDTLNADDLNFQGIDPSVLDFGGSPEAPALPGAPALPEGGSLPGAGDLNADALPSAEDLDSDALPGSGGFDAPALPGAGDLNSDALPGAEDFNSDALPSAEDFNSDALPGAGDFNSDALPGAGDLDSDALPSPDTAPTAIALPAPAGLPSADDDECDKHHDDAPDATTAAGDRFSAEDLVSSVI